MIRIANSIRLPRLGLHLRNESLPTGRMNQPIDRKARQPDGIPNQGSGFGLAMRIFSSSRCVLNYFDTGTVSQHKSPANLIPYAAPVWGPTLGTSPFPTGWMRQLHEGIAESLPENIHVLSKTLKADLRNSWWETARKMERFLDSESKNQLTQREKSSDFSWCVSGAPFSGLFPA